MSNNDKFLPESVSKLIIELNKLPTIGRKSAQRLCFHLLRQEKEDVEKLTRALENIVDGVKLCEKCYNLCEDRFCKICNTHSRNEQSICVVEQVLDLIAIENTHSYSGLYHVLHGSLSPLDGIGPADIKINELKTRILASQETDRPITEIILATSTSSEGEATSVYISEMLKNIDVKISRIASGLPVGGDLDYADETTLRRALQGRTIV